MQESSDTPEDDAEPAGEDTSNERADESSTNEARQSSKSNEEGSSEESVKENIADTIARRQAALYRSGLLKKQPPTRKAATAEKNTSLGERRVKSATQARRGVRRTTQLVDAVRQKARGIASSTPSPATNDADNNAKEAKGGDVKNRLSASRIHATVEELFKKRRKASTKSQSDRFTAALSSWGTSIGILGEIGESPKTEVLLESTSLVVRVATPMDDVDIANLRLSVFSDFSPDMRSQFCFRSCQALAHRRTRGAICVVATPPPTMVRPLVLGSAECSYHEFHSTRLGSRRLKDSLLYITEVAVHPSTRRQGTGVQMLEAIDDLAERQDIETIYLHVDVCNYAALNLYKKCGYALADEKDPTFQEFTESLNLHPGATRGRDHHLLYKNLRTPTWLEQRARQPEDKTRVIGSLGFEIPA
jgi:ribosomal protein S18 acetylase RimI-like enzyme